MTDERQRPPVTVEARRKAVDQTLTQLARTMEQLETAVTFFSPDFDLEAYSAAWYSKAPEKRNRAMLVRSNMDDLYNLCQTLIDRGVRLAQDLGAIPADRKTPPSDQLRNEDLYPDEVEQLMRQAAYLRNWSQHQYWTLAPDQVHEVVNAARACLPPFIAAIGAWVWGFEREGE